jgi:hypothetical protein
MRVLTVIKCGIGDCPSVFKTEEAVAPNVKYACKRHTETEQRVFFQDHQFDKDLKHGVKPIGTTHIKHQGSEILTSEQIGKPYSWQKEEESKNQ